MTGKPGLNPLPRMVIWLPAGAGLGVTVSAAALAVVVVRSRRPPASKTTSGSRRQRLRSPPFTGVIMTHLG